MKLENLKLTGAMLLLAASLGTNPLTSMTVYAENIEDDKPLFEDEKDDHELEDVSGGDVKPEEPTEEEPTEEPTEEEPESDPLENTDIDPEDEEYNTGREEIPDYVKTEWERKIGEPNKPNEPNKPTTPDEIDLPKTGNMITNILLGGAAIGVIYALGSEMHTRVMVENALFDKINAPTETKVPGSRKKFKRKSKEKILK